jgi:chemotaxis receptor (MCP) glutamine deamidase CheD
VKKHLSCQNSYGSTKNQLLGEDVGGSSGQRIVFNVTPGVATIFRFQGEIKTL